MHRVYDRMIIGKLLHTTQHLDLTNAQSELHSLAELLNRTSSHYFWEASALMQLIHKHYSFRYSGNARPTPVTLQGKEEIHFSAPYIL